MLSYWTFTFHNVPILPYGNVSLFSALEQFVKISAIWRGDVVQ